ncbi:hypothetical protein Pla100_62970 [Neorhodopirellula pilleata]|uniref:Uncharacterized protein n=1 Tax=Neorhodopirellula pilleata TaxID=2714738 RepID=A0A5C5YUU7_9BACT|nr:hypothetical protein Pla100_62970 [Neorhodopirellula pilleata]
MKVRLSGSQTRQKTRTVCLRRLNRVVTSLVLARKHPINPRIRSRIGTTIRTGVPSTEAITIQAIGCVGNPTGLLEQRT